MTGNTTPHQPDYSPAPGSSAAPAPGPRYSWAGGDSSAGNTPQYQHSTPAHTPVYEGAGSGDNTPQHDTENNDPVDNTDAGDDDGGDVEAEICQEYPSNSDDKK